MPATASTSSPPKTKTGCYEVRQNACFLGELTVGAFARTRFSQGRKAPRHSRSLATSPTPRRGFLTTQDKNPDAPRDDHSTAPQLIRALSAALWSALHSCHTTIQSCEHVVAHGGISRVGMSKRVGLDPLKNNLRRIEQSLLLGPLHKVVVQTQMFTGVAEENHFCLGAAISYPDDNDVTEPC